MPSTDTLRGVNFAYRIQTEYPVYVATGTGWVVASTLSSP